jgi:hypothetical protein
MMTKWVVIVLYTKYVPPSLVRVMIELELGPCPALVNA